MAAREHEEGRAAAAARDSGGPGLGGRDGYDGAYDDAYDDPRRTVSDPRGLPVTGQGRDTEVMR
jgi:hypothetical protein